MLLEWIQFLYSFELAHTKQYTKSQNAEYTVKAEILIKKIWFHDSANSLVILSNSGLFIPPATKLGGVYWNHHVCLSVRSSVRPSVCPAAFGFPAHYCFPFTPIIMKLHMQTPHEARMCPIDFEVKRSKVKVTMHKLLKMVSAHNCFPFTSIIMKLHMQTPHESRMCPIDFEVKRSKVKVTMHKLLKMVSGA